MVGIRTVLPLLFAAASLSADPLIANASGYGLPPLVQEWVTDTLYNGTLKKRQTVTFDRYGSVTSRQIVDAEGRLYKARDYLIILPDGWEDPDLRYDNQYEGGRLVSQMEHRSDGKVQETRYSYNVQGQISEYRVSDGRRYAVGYDDRGRRVTEDLFTGETHQYTEVCEYNTQGQLVAKRFTQHHYENSDRVERFSFSDGRLVRYERTSFNDKTVEDHTYDDGHLVGTVRTYVNPLGQENVFFYGWTYNGQGLKQHETIKNENRLAGTMETIGDTDFFYQDRLLVRKEVRKTNEVFEYRYQFY